MTCWLLLFISDDNGWVILRIFERIQKFSLSYPFLVPYSIVMCVYVIWRQSTATDNKNINKFESKWLSNKLSIIHVRINFRKIMPVTEQWIKNKNRQRRWEWRPNNQKDMNGKEKNNNIQRQKIKIIWNWHTDECLSFLAHWSYSTHQILIQITSIFLWVFFFFSCILDFDGRQAACLAVEVLSTSCQWRYCNAKRHSWRNDL